MAISHFDLQMNAFDWLPELECSLLNASIMINYRARKNYTQPFSKWNEHFMIICLIRSEFSRMVFDEQAAKRNDGKQHFERTCIRTFIHSSHFSISLITTLRHFIASIFMRDALNDYMPSVDDNPLERESTSIKRPRIVMTTATKTTTTTMPIAEWRRL